MSARLVNRINRKKKATAPAATLLSTMTRVRMLSSVTNAPFSKQCQEVLHSKAREKLYASRYWLTQAQARRTCNAAILPGEKPTVIYLNVEKVVPLVSLSRTLQKRIMDDYPPFFGSGVGILTMRKKWNAVTADRLVSKLNPKQAERALFLDACLAEELGFEATKDITINIRSFSSVLVYNSDQLDDPYKGEPQKGLALNAVTGKRLGQPAHDILLAVSIMRGYTSPMWVSEKQMKYLNVSVRKGRESDGVIAPNMTGMIVSLSALPKKAQQELLKELRSRADAFGYDVYFLYSVNGWEVIRARSIVKNMAAVDDKEYPFHFVNLRDLGYQKPAFAQFARCLYMRHSPIGKAAIDLGIVVKDVPKLILANAEEIRDASPQRSPKKGKKAGKKNSSYVADDVDAAAEGDDTLDLLEENHGDNEDGDGDGHSAAHVEEDGAHSKTEKEVKDVHMTAASTVASDGESVWSVQLTGEGIRHFFAEDATQRRYYNAECTSHPHLTMPAVRSIAFFRGRLIGRRDEALLRSFALKHKLSSPVWITESIAAQFGVGIAEKHRNDFVQIGAAAAAASGQVVNETEEFYNIDDFESKEDILTAFPKKSSSVHYMLDSKWRPVLGKNKQSFLTGIGKETPLWISMSECLMSGFTPRKGAHKFSFPRPKNETDTDSGGPKLYNSQFTTDPVRVIGSATCYIRPQGYSL